MSSLSKAGEPMLLAASCPRITCKNFKIGNFYENVHRPIPNLNIIMFFHQEIRFLAHKKNMTTIKKPAKLPDKLCKFLSLLIRLDAYAIRSHRHH